MLRAFYRSGEDHRIKRLSASILRHVRALTNECRLNQGPALVRQRWNGTPPYYQATSTMYPHVRADHRSFDESKSPYIHGAVRSSSNRFAHVLYSPRTSMSSLTLTSKFRMILTASSRLCMMLSQHSPIGRRSWLPVFCWAFGIRVSWLLRKRDYNIVDAHTLV